MRRLLIVVTVLVLALAALMPRPVKAQPSGHVKAVILKVFGPSRARAATAIAYCESRLDPRAVNASGHVGLYQVSYRWHHRRGESFATFRKRMVDPLENARFAYRLSRGGTTWSAWDCAWAAS